MLLPVDEPPDMLYRLITHELTHIFEFDIIPRSLVRRTVPLWVDEGLADYMAGVWRPMDLMLVRDATVADIIPKMTKFEGYGQFTNPRVVYDLGHAAFEFIEAKWGKEGIRQYLFSLRKSVIGGGEAAYEEALRVTADEFDQQFEKYMKDRFKPFRDKERPADYGRDLAPERGETKFTAVLTVEPSPSGDLLAAVAGNVKEGELDVVLLSTKDRTVVRNLTPGFSKDTGFEYIAVPGARWNTVPWLAWAPTGDRIAYFARTEKQRSLILQNIVTGKIEKRYYLASVDAPESPEFSKDGRRVYFSGLRNAIGDIFEIDLETTEVRNLTSDAFADYAPAMSPDGSYLVYMARISGNDKLFRLDLASGNKTQLTFGTHDEAAAQFMDANTLVFPSTAVDPAAPVDPEVVKNGQIFNLWTLDLKSGALKQYTDTLTSNVSPVALADPEGPKVAFVTYYKGEYGIHTLNLREPIAAATSADFGEPGPVIDFQAPLTHTLIPANNRVKGRFEKMFLDGRPPINVGVTSGGDLFGGTAISFSDVLGDQNFTFFAASVAQYRTFAGSYTNLSRRVQYSIQAFSQTQFYYGLQPGYYDPSLTYFLDRDDAIATRTINGASAFAIYPFNRYTRLELSGGISYYDEGFENQQLEDYSNDYQEALYGAVGLQQRLRDAPHGRADARDDGVPRVRSAGRAHVPGGVHRRAQGRRLAVAADVRRRLPLLPAHRDQRRRGVPVPRLQQHGRHAGLLLLRRQLRTAWLRLPAVCRQQGLLRQRGTAVPADRGDAHADWRARRRAGRVLRRHRRLEPVRTADDDRLQHWPARREIQLRDDIGRSGQPDHRLQPGSDNGHSDPDLRRTARRQRLPPRRRPRLLRHGPRDVPPRLPDPLRLVVEDPVQQGLGRHRLLIPRRQLGIPQVPLPGLDRVRLLAER